MDVEGRDFSPELQCKTPKPVSLCVPPRHFWDAHMLRSALTPCTTPLSKAIPISGLFKLTRIQKPPYFTISVSSVASARRYVTSVPHEYQQDWTFQEMLLWPFPSKIMLLLGFLQQTRVLNLGQPNRIPVSVWWDSNSSLPKQVL